MALPLTRILNNRELQIDYEKFHKLAGLASVHSARELMRVTKNKLKSEYGALGAAVASANAAKASPTKTSPVKKTAATPRSGAKRGRPAKAVSEEGEEDEEDHTPPPKKTKTGGGGKVKVEPVADFEEDDGLLL